MYWGCYTVIKNENTRITVTVPKNLYKMLKEDAEYEDRSISNLALKILKDYYKLKNED